MGTGPELSNRDRPLIRNLVSRNSNSDFRKHEKLVPLDEVLHQSYGLAGAARQDGGGTSANESSWQNGNFTLAQYSTSNMEQVQVSPTFPLATDHLSSSQGRNRVSAPTQEDYAIKYMFHSHYSSERLTYFLCKSCILPLLVKTCWHSWLAIMALSILTHDGNRSTILSGIGFGLIFTQLIYQVFATGLIHKFDLINKDKSLQRRNIHLDNENKDNFSYNVKERAPLLLQEARIVIIAYWICAYALMIACTRPILGGIGIE